MRYRVEGDVLSEDHAAGKTRGIKVRVPDIDLSGVEDLRKVGNWAKKLARRMGKERDQVWVWVYGPDMDLQGPAVCVAYWKKGEGSKVEFTPWEVIALWTIGNLESGEVAPVG